MQKFKEIQYFNSSLFKVFYVLEIFHKIYGTRNTGTRDICVEIFFTTIQSSKH